LPQNFQILDSEDQYRVIKRLLKALELDEAYWPPRQAQWFINGHKDAGVARPSSRGPGPADPPVDPHLPRIRGQLQTLRPGGFAELLLRAFELLRDNAAMREHYQSRFRQCWWTNFRTPMPSSTNWLNCSRAGTTTCSCRRRRPVDLWLARRAGGQHSQVREGPPRHNSYPPRTELSFHRQYPEGRNAVIAHNEGRLARSCGPTMKTASVLCCTPRSTRSTRRVSCSTHSVLERRHKRAEIAILYRPMPSPRIRGVAVQTGVPYRVYGGLRFFEAPKSRTHWLT